MKHGAILAALAVLLGAISAHGSSPKADPFLEEHAHAVAANVYDAFSIRFTDERRIFRAREPIDIELVYERPAQFRVGPVDGSDALSLIRGRFDRAVDSPLQAIDSRFDEGVPDGLVGCGSPSAPTVVRRTLNYLYRFDTPGRYRMFLESRQVAPEFQASNILEFEILPRDEVWERETLTGAELTLRESPLNSRAAAHAFRTLRVLATNKATAILAQYYQAGHSDLETADVRFGLFANPDRAVVVEALAHELRNPKRTFGGWFMPTLAHLELARRHPEGPPFSHDEYRDIIRQFAITRATALNRVPGRLARAFRQELMASPSDEQFVQGVVTPAVRDFPQEATAAFLGLGAEAQRSRLYGTWRRFADPVFVPLLRTLYSSPANGSDAVRDIALRRLFELAPGEGRTAMLAELSRDKPRVSSETLARLPDRAFPEYQGRWAVLLERATTDQDRLSAAQRIERFGTHSIAAPIERFYARNDGSLSCGTRAVLLAYLVRVDPELGHHLLATAAKATTWDDSCFRSLLEDTADLEWTPAVEAAAIDVLAYPDLGAAGSASRVLARYGSAAARQPLEARLEQIQSVLYRPAAPLETTAPHPVESALARALAGARSWTLTREERMRFGARCSDGRDCDGAFSLERRLEPRITMSAPRPRIGHEDQMEFSVDGYDGRSLEDLDQKLRQFQPGTSIFWNDRPHDGRDALDGWTLAERDELFERFRRDASHYGVILQRDRTLIRHSGRLEFGPRVDLGSRRSAPMLESRGCG